MSCTLRPRSSPTLSRADKDGPCGAKNEAGKVILIGLGGNLDSPVYGAPRATLEAALAALEGEGIRVLRRSRFYRSAPVPPSDQPDFVNAVAALDSPLAARPLLAALLAVEQRLGRVRGPRNAARMLDLDLLDHDGAVIATGDLELPHPRLHERRFVLLPLAEIAPHWRHPLLRLTARELLAALPAGQQVEPFAE
jgi:2-amino-4-hydroxy-6-hydroxymethyldihydropteridine diphosphokinase